MGEDLSLATGGWIIYYAITGADESSRRLVRASFGLSLLPIGLSHFVYLHGAAQLIPAWFPLRVPLTALTGAAHIAAGLAILFNIVPRLAATLEALMESLFTLICWVTAVVANPTDRQNWVNVFISATLSAAAWAVADSCRGLRQHERSTLSPADAAERRDPSAIM
ncbi:MAG TPA: hypothetical protein VFO44_01240 [Steroidobacteraceae bacterium]|nr:hypothetical protein [Steroidobacteraceae bacterium]